jgi:hypothetical protein
MTNPKVKAVDNRHVCKKQTSGCCDIESELKGVRAQKNCSLLTRIKGAEMRVLIECTVSSQKACAELAKIECILDKTCSLPLCVVVQAAVL